MNVSFRLSLALSHLSPPPLPFTLLFPPSGYRHATSGRVQRTRGWRDAATLGIYYLKPVVQRPSLFSRAPRIWARTWLSFFPISLARRHHAVTDDVPLYRDGFFAVDVCRAWRSYRHRPSGCVRAYASVLSPRVRYHYLRNMNDK